MFASSIKNLFFLTIGLILFSSSTQVYCKKVYKPQDISTQKKQCRITIIGNDSMEFRNEKKELITEIRFPATCSELTIDFLYEGELPAGTMGHNLVVSEKKNKAAITADALKQGRSNNYLPSKNNLSVLASSHYTLGGSKKDKKRDLFVISRKQLGTTIKDLVYFCAFPGHCHRMSGPFIVEDFILTKNKGKDEQSISKTLATKDKQVKKPQKEAKLSNLSSTKEVLG